MTFKTAQTTTKRAGQGREFAAQRNNYVWQHMQPPFPQGAVTLSGTAHYWREEGLKLNPNHLQVIGSVVGPT